MHIKYFVSALALAFACEAAVAETPRPASAMVKLTDLNLDTAKGQTQLRIRFTQRINAICGHPSVTALTQVNTGKGRVERFRCVEALTIDSADPRVNAQFQLAKLN